MRTAAALLLAAAALAGGEIRLRPPLRVDRDDAHVPAQPKVREASELFAITYNSWLRHLSPERKAVAAHDSGALNVNAWDDVPDSSWFTNRITRRALSFGEVVASLAGKPPEPGAWTVLRINDEGYTPKLDIRDAAGRTYTLKFDLPEALERNSGAERIGTLIMHAAGYFVPHNSVAFFRREDLRLTEKSEYKDAAGKKRRMTAADLESGFRRLKPLPDGRYRGLASLWLPGAPVGRFMYAGLRPDDPNDIIPHELRRELRGLRVLASWFNHVDVGDKNALDIYFTAPDGRKYVRHCFLDFGSTLGSGDFVNGPWRVGHEYIFDGAAMGRALLTLGIWRRPWEARGRIRYPEIGYFDAELFEPQKWKPNYPNLAFERMDEGDAWWGALIVTAFDDGLVDGLAASAQYSRAEVAACVAQVLKQRRDAIGRYWLDRVTPLDQPSYRDGRLRFRDLAIERGYAEAAGRRYRYRLEGGGAGEFSGAELALKLPQGLRGARDRWGRTTLARLWIRSNRRGNGWAAPVEIILGRSAEASPIEVLGWRHGAR